MKGDTALRRLAVDLLSQYDVEIATCHLVARSYNTVYRIDALDGRRFALRVSPEHRLHREQVEQVEAEWTAALASDGFPTPAVIPNRTGGFVSRAERSDMSGERTAVLFEWVPGRPLLEQPRLQHMAETGRLMAMLHDHPSAHRVPRPSVFVTDRVLYFGGPDLLATTGHGSLFSDARDAAQQVIDELWNAAGDNAHLIHGDVHGANVMVHRNRLTVIDFQDLAWGLDIVDLSITTAALRHFRRDERSLDPDEAIQQLRAGYERTRPWPEASPYTWQALESARMLNVFNLSITVDPARPFEYFERHERIQRAFLTETRRMGVGV